MSARGTKGSLLLTKKKLEEAKKERQQKALPENKATQPLQSLTVTASTTEKDTERMARRKRLVEALEKTAAKNSGH